MEAFADWLSGTEASAVIQKGLWIIPLVQTIHIIFLALVFSSVVMIEFRIFGVTRSRTVEETAQRFLPWIFAGVAVLAISGAVLIVGEPQRSLPSFEFQAKMVFLAIALALTIVFARSVHQHAAIWTNGDTASVHAGTRAIVNALALVTLAAWALVLVYGRWIAYTAPH